MPYSTMLYQEFSDLMIEHGKRRELDGIKSVEEMNAFYSRELEEAKEILRKIS